MEQENEQEWIGGRNPVLEVLRSDRDIHKIYVQEGSQKGVLKQVLTLAKERKIQVQFVPKQKIEKVVSGAHQGVVAQVAAYQYAELDDLFAAAEAKDEMPFFIILDELEDPHNLGSIMRTADSVGAHGIIIPKRRSVGLTQTVAKASTGAMEYVPVVRVTNMVRTMEELQKRGLWIFGTDAKGSSDYRTMDVDMPLAIVIGSEGFGMSRLVREKCDFLVHLPMRGKVTSLNASVAASLLLYEVYRKRFPLEK
ncbi:23S rRNA (guanosine(2251)-2'-O)-methyltransferase RlmB [Listeria monocytogenes]|uniref:23S rRNA (guanosine(2251)-2'-O)-methyltransferase RlmB n=1 Tax=Listeria monocytogenes TaxID=1639 RepID=UPI0022FDEDF4|nr:23S rRNA (guanosine(2251)-2'-O)-methyltransferase RlmB [Listeria monocytogenes]MDA6019087.1 23S rRNA (guanosine(2251)-2'-O)-methyltransferase RlmB [Listeria monocytogenes]MDA6027801.1 23S rRNA (guanosine(2251)-2'-O)-methyltransferase RlmB [Listeria monocytogenes]